MGRGEEADVRATMAPRSAGSSCFMHPSAWKGNSANFGCRGFSEVRVAPGPRESAMLPPARIVAPRGLAHETGAGPVF